MYEAEKVYPQLCLGIDLGTSNSCVAIFSDKNEVSPQNPEVIANSLSKRTTPSCVSFTDDSILIGESAREKQNQFPDSTFSLVKRFIGRKFNDFHFRKDKNNFTFKIHKGDRDLPILKVEKGKYKGLELFPEEISALVLSQLYKDSKTKSTKPTKDVVVTVPANFNEYQKRATKDAAKVAGLNPIAVLSEPVAAAIDFAFTTGTINKEGKTNVFVFDFGGGTLDVAIVEIENSKFTVVATAGDNQFGGADIDKFIFKEQCEIINERHKIDLAKQNIINNKLKRLKSTLLQKCEEAKIILSTEASTKIELGIGEDEFFVNQVNRAFIDKFVGDNESKFLGPIDQVLEQSKLKKDDISNVILIGGSSGIPSIRELIKKKLGSAESPVNPDEAIARGAAIYGAYIIKKGDLNFHPNRCEKLQIQDVTPMAIGIRLQDNLFDVHIKRNTPLPCEGRLRRYVSQGKNKDGEKSIRLSVYEGDSNRCNENHFVGKFDIPFPANKKNDEFQVVWAKIRVDQKGVHMFAVRSDTEPSKDSINYELMKIENEKPGHTSDEMRKMRNTNMRLFGFDDTDKPETFDSPTPEILQKYTKILNVINTKKSSFAKDKKTKKNIEEIIKEEKEEIKEMEEMDRKTLLSKLDEIEGELKEICEYKRPSQIDDIIDEIRSYFIEIGEEDTQEEDEDEPTPEIRAAYLGIINNINTKKFSFTKDKVQRKNIEEIIKDEKEEIEGIREMNIKTLHDRLDTIEEKLKEVCDYKRPQQVEEKLKNPTKSDDE